MSCVCFGASVSEIYIECIFIYIYIYIYIYSECMSVCVCVCVCVCGWVNVNKHYACQRLRVVTPGRLYTLCN